jgi:hypothetical protein
MDVFWEKFVSQSADAVRHLLEFLVLPSLVSEDHSKMG